MPYIPGQQTNAGIYVPTTQVYDVLTGNIDVNSDQFKQLFVKLYQTINQIALALNLKESGYYIEEEFLTSSLVFNPLSSNPLERRQMFRKTINTGALGAGANAIAHGLTIGSTWKFIKIFGAANDNVTPVYYPIPTTNLTITVGPANIVITNGTGVAFTSSTVVLEYVKT